MVGLVSVPREQNRRPPVGLDTQIISEEKRLSLKVQLTNKEPLICIHRYRWAIKRNKNLLSLTDGVTPATQLSG